MPYIAIQCNTCNKRVTVNSEVTLGDLRIIELSCGHEQYEKTIEVNKSVINEYKSVNGKTPRQYQKDGIKFSEKSGLRCLIADEMRLGKTPQALIAVKLNKEMTYPCAIVCKSSLKEQWARECYEWTGSDLVAVIQSAADAIPAGCEFYIFSFDIFRRFKKGKTKDVIADSLIDGQLYESDVKDAKDDEIVNIFKKLKIKCIIIDECQQIKSRTSQRTIEIRNLIQDIKIKHIIALSGTPIKNSAAEYFTVLNLIRPEYFPVYKSYLRRWVDSYMQGNTVKWGGLCDPEGFKQFTKDFVIRRERNEVMPDLPKVDRNFKFSYLGDEVKDAYAATLKEFQEYAEGSDNKGTEKMVHLLAYMNKMRHLTGIAKVESALDFATEYLTSCNRKLVFFVHHKDVGLMLCNKLDELCKMGGLAAPIMLSADIAPQNRQPIIDKFLQSDCRFAIASTLAYGEGVTMKECADCVIVERQWNPANEEQAESRFIHMEQKESKINATYLVAVSTIDEFFSELVERKRAIFSNTMSGKEIEWDESSIMKELTDILANSGKTRWRI